MRKNCGWCLSASRDKVAISIVRGLAMDYVPPMVVAQDWAKRSERCWLVPGTGRPGTLHESSVTTFLRGDYWNQRATVADWMAATAWRHALRSERDFARLCRAVDSFLPVYRALLRHPDSRYDPRTTAASAALALLWQGQSRWFPAYVE